MPTDELEMPSSCISGCHQAYQDNPLRGHAVTFIAHFNLERTYMDSEPLLQATPEELAQTLLNRRLLLKEQLPTVIRTLEAEEEVIGPKAAKVIEKHKHANEKVSGFKKQRDESQRKARELIPKIKQYQEKLVDSGGMVNLDPNWKKEKLLEELDNIEKKIQTVALDHKDEKKLIDQRKKLLDKNEKWLKSRRDSNPEMAEYIDSRKLISELFRNADKAHKDMLIAVEKAQPLHDKKIVLNEELREIRRQMDRAKELLSQSDSAIEHWRRRMSEGFGDLGQGYPDLLANKRRVENGGNSTFARKNKKTKNILKTSKNISEEEE